MKVHHQTPPSSPMISYNTRVHRSGRREIIVLYKPNFEQTWFEWYFQAILLLFYFLVAFSFSITGSLHFCLKSVETLLWYISGLWLETSDGYSCSDSAIYFHLSKLKDSVFSLILDNCIIILASLLCSQSAHNAWSKMCLCSQVNSSAVPSKKY